MSDIQNFSLADVLSNTTVEDNDDEQQTQQQIEVEDAVNSTPPPSTSIQTDEILNQPSSTVTPEVVQEVPTQEFSISDILSTPEEPEINVSDSDIGNLSAEEQTELGLVNGGIDPRLQSKYASEIPDIILSSEAQTEAMLEEIELREQQRQALEAQGAITQSTDNERFLLESQTLTRAAQHEELRDNLQMLLEDNNPLRASSVNALLDTDLSLSEINFIVSGSEWVPVYGGVLTALDMPEHVLMAAEYWNEGDYKNAAIMGASVSAEAVIGIVGAKGAYKVVRDRVRKRRETFAKIVDASEETVKARLGNAEKVAKANTKLSDQMIREYELSIDPSGNTKVSKKVNGKLVLDPELARQAGIGIADDVYNLQSQRMSEFTIAAAQKNSDAVAALERKHGVGATQVFTTAEETADDFVSPLLKPESFNSVVAVAADLKKKFPDAFDNDNTVIDNLFRLTVSDQFDADDLADTLAEYGMNFDQYILTVVGSGSEAGKILNKLSQIKRAGSFKVDNVKTREIERSQSGIVSAWRRLENIRRGSMTSMLKTAMRNFQSATIRAPMESLENVMDTTMLAMSNEFASKSDRMLLKRTFSATVKGGQTLVSPSQWKGSLAPLKRIYATPYASKQLTDIILDRPEFTQQYSALFDNVNEYRKRTGAGSGGAVDATLGAAESVVDVLSIPNRIQEYVIRRGVFTGEVERLLQRDWGVNMMEALENGSLPDIVANASSVRPKGARPFEEIVEEATKRALDVTYAKAPDVPEFKRISDFLSQTGLTAVTTPFPRFMFNSIELMGQYSAGAFNPAIKRAIGKKSGPLDAKDRQNISRNLSGLVAITAAYQYRTSDGAPADYKQIEGIDNVTGEDTVIDTTSQYPMRQMLWIAEALRRLDPDVQGKLPVSGPLTAAGAIGEGDATFDEWFDGKDAAEVFLGVGARTGMSNIFVDEIASILGGDGGDVISAERRDRVIGRAIGDYLRTHLIPATQVVEIQRMVGVRPVEYKDYSGDGPATIGSQIQRSLDQSGVTSILDPKSEFELPSREFVMAEDRKRTALGLGLMAGITVLQKNNDDAEYLISKGFSEFELGSKERGSIRREENKLMREFLPDIVSLAKDIESDARKSYDKENRAYKKKYTLEEHVNAEVLAVIGQQIKKTKSLIGDMKFMETDDAVLEYRTFSRMPPAARKYALREFYRENGEAPVLTDFDDLLDLQFYAKEVTK